MIKLDILVLVLILINIVLTSIYLSNISKKETFNDTVRNYKQTLSSEYRRFLNDNY